MKTAKILIGLLTTAALAAATPVPALAQSMMRAAFGPGDPVPAAQLRGAGAVGAELASLVGTRPVLIVFWRPGDGQSEQSLLSADLLVRGSAPGTTLMPVAFVAAGQPATDVERRLAALGMSAYPPRPDAGGTLARMFGVVTIPSYALVDVGGVLRLVGGTDVSQPGPTGITIQQAVQLAAQGRPVPTLGILAANPVFRMLGRKLPDVALTALDGASAGRMPALAGRGKRLLVYYWSPNCPHCVVALPKLFAWYRQKGPADVELVGIARGDAPELRTKAVELLKGAPGRHFFDVDRNVGTGLLVRETPTAYLVATDGEILGIRTGGLVEWDAWIGSQAKAGSTRRPG